MAEPFEVACLAVEEDEEKQWFWDFHRQALFRSDKSSGQLRFLMSAPQEDIQEGYCRVIKYRDRLAVIPKLAAHILLYDIETGISSRIPLPVGIWNESAQKKGKFLNGMMVGSELILLPSWSGMICKVDMERERVIAVKDLSGAGISFNGALPFRSFLLRDGCIYMPSCEKPVLFMVDVHTLRFTKKVFANCKKGFCSIVRQENDYWLLPRYEDDIIKWNPDTNREERFSIPGGFSPKPGRAAFGPSAGNGVYLWLFPTTAPNVLRIDMRTGFIEEEKAFKKYSMYERDTDTYAKYWMAKAESPFLKVCSAKKGMLLCFDTETGKICEAPYYLPESEKKRYVRDNVRSDLILVENSQIGLDDYVCLIQEICTITNQNRGHLSFGSKIYRALPPVQKKER